MASIKDLKNEQKSLMLQQQVVAELNTLVKDIERCEKTILDLQSELNEVNTKYPSPRTTRQDVAYLTDLLKCAQKKLAWEKQIASMQKRTPATLQKMAQLLNDEKNPPADAMKVEMMKALQGVQAAMGRLQGMKTSEEGENIQQSTSNVEHPIPGSEEK
jgi:hypothetical protein